MGGGVNRILHIFCQDLTGLIRCGCYPAAVLGRPFQFLFCKRFSGPPLEYGERASRKWLLLPSRWSAALVHIGKGALRGEQERGHEEERWNHLPGRNLRQHFHSQRPADGLRDHAGHLRAKTGRGSPAPAEARAGRLLRRIAPELALGGTGRAHSAGQPGGTRAGQPHRGGNYRAPRIRAAR